MLRRPEALAALEEQVAARGSPGAAGRHDRAARRRVPRQRSTSRDRCCRGWARRSDAVRRSSSSPETTTTRSCARGSASDWRRAGRCRRPGAWRGARLRELDDLCRLLAPARVQVRYPGVWLAPRVFATHGHYVDRHLLAALSSQVWPPEGRRGDPSGRHGVRRPTRNRRMGRSERPHGSVGSTRAAARRAGADSTPRDARPSPTTSGARRRHRRARRRCSTASLPEPLAAGAVAALGATRRAVIAGLPRDRARDADARRVGGLGGAARARPRRRGALPGDRRAWRSDLGIDADAIVFGHIHRRGPLPSDPPAMWRPGGGAGPRLLNTRRRGSGTRRCADARAARGPTAPAARCC